MKLQKAAQVTSGEMQSRTHTGVGGKISTESWLRPHPRFQLERILVPVDFSEHSKNALQHALALAGEFQAELVLLHVVQPYPIVPDLPSATPEMNSILQQDAEKDLQALADTIKDIPVKQVVRIGDPARIIADEAAQQEADLIVINTHGRTGLAHLFIGSVAEHVVRLANCPVLTYRERGHGFKKRRADETDLNRIAGEPAPR